MSVIVKTETETVGAFRQVIHFEKNGQMIFADSAKEGGGGETAQSPHDLFDASLAACKALTAHFYARQRNFPLERVTAVLERDGSKETQGQYELTVTVKFEGPLTDEQRARLLDVTGRCPVHKLMTTTEITIVTKAATA